jgi:hypothetical protein
MLGPKIIHAFYPIHLYFNFAKGMPYSRYGTLFKNISKWVTLFAKRVTSISIGGWVTPFTNIYPDQERHPIREWSIPFRMADIREWGRIYNTHLPSSFPDGARA